MRILKILLCLALLLAGAAGAGAQSNMGGGGSGSGGSGIFGPNYSVGGGTVQAQTVAPTTAVTNATLVNGYQICWLPNAANTGAAPTLAGGGTSTFTAKPITKVGAGGLTALIANDIVTTAIACAIYDGTEFQLQNPQAGIVVSSSISTGSGASAAGATATGGFAAVEATSTGWTPTAGQDYCRADSTLHSFVCSENGLAEVVLGNSTFSGITTGTNTTATMTVGAGATLNGATTGIFDMSPLTTANNFKIPVIAGAAPTANGAISYDSTANEYKGSVSGATNIFPSVTGTTNPTTGRAAFWGANGTLAAGVGTAFISAASGSVNISANGADTSIVGVANLLGTSDLFYQASPSGGAAYTVFEDAGVVGLGFTTSGTRPIVMAPNRAITAKFLSGGSLALGTTVPACAGASLAAICAQETITPTPAANVDALYPDSTNHCYQVINGLATNGCAVASTQTIVTIGSGADIAATSLCSTTNCPAGTYRVDIYIDMTTPCGTTGTFIAWLGYTDDSGARTGSSTTTFFDIAGTGSVPATGTLTTTSTANFGQATYILRTTGAATGGLGSINYGATRTACGSAGPMVGKMYLTVENLSQK